MAVKSNFEKVIDSLSVQFVKAKHIQVLKPVTVQDDKNLNNRLIILHKGRMSIKHNNKTTILYPDRMYCLPAGTLVDITYGENPIATVPYVDPDKRLENYLAEIEPGSPPFSGEIFSIIEFKVKAYNAIDFFKFLELSIFEIESSESMNIIINDILQESKGALIGKDLILNSKMVGFIVLLIRYLIERKLFLQEIGLKIDALMDKRLVDIFTYIASNLNKDLRNPVIAEQVGLSDEYVGQFFKKYTSINLQEYVKTVRLTKAIELVTTTNMQIQEICKRVGIDDFAYFCRVFKEAMGTSPKQMQKRPHFSK